MSFTAFQQQLLELMNGVSVEEYTFVAKDFAGTAAWTEEITGPAGLRGRVLGVHVFQVSEVFAAGDADASVQVGDGSDADLYALTANITAVAVGSDVRPAVTLGATPTIPADATVTITGVQGSTPTTGIANVKVTIAWFL